MIPAEPGLRIPQCWQTDFLWVQLYRFCVFAYTLKRKCHFDEIFITGLTRSCHFQYGTSDENFAKMIFCKFSHTLKQNCHFDEIFITGYTGSCQNENFQCSQWRHFRQNGNISVSENSFQYVHLHTRIWNFSMFRAHTHPLLTQMRHGDSNHRRLDCLLKRLFKHTSKKTPKHPGLCERNLPVTDGFPSQRVNSAEHVSIWWRHRSWVTGGFPSQRTSDAALKFSLVLALGNSWISSRMAGDLERHDMNVASP